MNTNGILQVTSSGRYEESITRQVSDLVVSHLKRESSMESVKRDVASGLPFVDEAWINSNFTAPNERTESQEEALSLSNELVVEVQNAEHSVIAAPLYNFSIPASLKAWIDLIARVQLTFHFNDNGQPEGLLKNKKAYVVMASGGTPLGSDWDTATPYIKQILAFIGITAVTMIDASTIDYSNKENSQSALTQIAELIN